MADTRSNVAERYASALFDLAVESGDIDSVEAELTTLGSALAESDDLRRLIASPVFDLNAKASAMNALLEKANAAPLVKNFVALVASNGRLSTLEPMIRAFDALAAEHRGEVSAEAVTARPLTDDQETALRSQIEASVGKTVKLQTRVDDSLLGGLVVKVGSRMIDSSLRTKLTRLQQSLKEA